MLHVRPDGSLEAKTLSNGDVVRLFHAAREHSRLAHVLISTAYNGAFRVCELLHLRPGDFNFAWNKVSVIPAKKARIVGKDLPPALDYPMPENAMTCVSDWISRNTIEPQAWLFKGAVRTCHVVKYPCPGGHLSTREVQRIFDEVLDLAAIKMPGRGIHTLKHARLTELAEKTKDPWFVKAAGRHESIAMSDVYVKYSDLPQRIRRIGAIL